MGVLASERERCEEIYHDNPKDWDERKYRNKLKKQRQWTETKATIIVTGKLKKKEEKMKNQFNNDIDLFANLYFNQNYTHRAALWHIQRVPC